MKPCVSNHHPIHETVKTRFVDDGNVLNSTGGLHFTDPFVLFINVYFNGICRAAAYHHHCHLFELFRIRQLAGKDERIKTGFVDDGGILCSELGGDLPPSFIFLINVCSQCIFRLFVPQNLRYVFTGKPRPTLN